MGEQAVPYLVEDRVGPGHYGVVLRMPPRLPGPVALPQILCLGAGLLGYRVPCRLRVHSLVGEREGWSLYPPGSEKSPFGELRSPVCSVRNNSSPCRPQTHSHRRQTTYAAELLGCCRPFLGQGVARPIREGGGYTSFGRSLFSKPPIGYGLGFCHPPFELFYVSFRYQLDETS
jgi:hypothetical protein